jgi:dGTPase
MPRAARINYTYAGGMTVPEFINTRDMLYEREKRVFSKLAFYTSDTKGREYPVSECLLRTEFQRDRDRIIHSKSFRRLMRKTQVFLSPEGDHYRTRLTHTLEVCQIGRTIARSLCINEDLTEAIALGHDLGHTPFGHCGERVLQRCYDAGFTHYKQSLRVVEKLEKLNLTYEVRDGILNHTLGGASTLEGRIIKIADKIAYINHDIDDALRAGILEINDIPPDVISVLGASHGERIDRMVVSVINETLRTGNAAMEAEINRYTEKLHNFLFENVYTNVTAKSEESKAEKLLETLYNYYVGKPDEMPEEYKNYIDAENNVERVVCDYISGMTDRYAVNLYRSLFIPEVWNNQMR